MPNKKAISLLEVLVAAIVLALVAGGLISTFLTVRKYIRHAKERSTATALSYSHVKTLYEDVRADSWNTGSLSNGLNQSLPVGGQNWSSIDNINYQSANTKYKVDNVGGQPYREVTITVEYPD
ncbi:MAG: prepilin-type N-terminal cleavage/methylation domain-containing protein [Candidatus Omnitrophica bacterium]|nr:prepilin-type N-terminal cleavage/methylation domain-containing protein [Candidatus Omnitrophota bacterium]MCF7894428.1 prepilin-type N-terminal cleavage/methylation domain-containing protein [Candidatus Omnitrophota bacterium]